MWHKFTHKKEEEDGTHTYAATGSNQYGEEIVNDKATSVACRRVLVLAKMM